MPATYYIACDFGAESGRVMLGILDHGKLALDEIHRFPTGGVSMAGTLRWDVPRFYDEILAGMRKVAKLGVPITSVSTDSWGVDFVLLRDREPLLTLPYHYRDARTDATCAEVRRQLTDAVIFGESGIQFMALNTIYQLADDARHRRGILEFADGFLGIGDYFNYLLSGVRACEVSYASTTQLYNPKSRTWSRRLADGIGLPQRLFPEICASGTPLGPLAPALAAELGWPETRVVATCSHDTGAAIAAVPGQGNDWSYLSSGTWSLLGAELAEPVIDDRSRAANFTNEVGYGHSIRFLKNIVGLWILQECRRAWAAEGDDYSYENLAQMAQNSPPLHSLIHPDWPPFGKPGDMPAKIGDFCRRTGQPAPDSPGAFARCVLESLALLYRGVLDTLDELTGRSTRKLHIVGGGSRNDLLNQLAANATGRSVLAGPVEATAIGNILIQALAAGHLPNLEAVRETVRDSFPVRTYDPEDGDDWAAACQRFAALPLPDAAF